MAVGASWSADYVDPKPHGVQTFAHFHTTYKVVGWEDVTVPAGTFRALKVEANGTIDAKVTIPASAASAAVASAAGGTTVGHVQHAQTGTIRAISYNAFYYVPAVKYFVKSVEEQYNTDNVRTSRDTRVLVSYKVAPLGGGETTASHPTP